MPNIKSAKKRVKTIAKKKEINNDYKASMRTAIKKVDKLVLEGKKEEANLALNDAVKKIDKALAKGLVHRNYASRHKSSLMKKVTELK